MGSPENLIYALFSDVLLFVESLMWLKSCNAIDNFLLWYSFLEVIIKTASHIHIK